MNDHHARITEQLEDYWRQLKGDKVLPLESDVNPDVMGDAWKSCFLVTARANGSFAYNYLGDSLVEAYGDDFTGREITETLLFPHPEALFATFKKVAATAQPITDEDEFTNSRGALIRYRSCVVPLAGTHGGGVGFLLGGMKWKAY
jgi:hypothetical protein